MKTGRQARLLLDLLCAFIRYIHTHRNTQSFLQNLFRLLQRPRYVQSGLLPEFAMKGGRDAFVKNHPVPPFEKPEWKDDSKMTMEARWAKYKDAMGQTPELLKQVCVSADGKCAVGAKSSFLLENFCSLCVYSVLKVPLNANLLHRGCACAYVMCVCVHLCLRVHACVRACIIASVRVRACLLVHILTDKETACII